VSHKIDEVLRLADRITVLRDGKLVGSVARQDATEQGIVNMMVGRGLTREGFRLAEGVGEPLIEVKDLCGERFRNVTFSLRKGEILAFSGLVGAGRSETARAIFGADRFTSGEIVFEGRPTRFRSPQDAIRAGVAMVQEDRKVLSLFMNMRIVHNMTLARLPFMSRGVVSDGTEHRLGEDLVRQLDIRLASLDDPVSSLSGGNQQKTVLGRWLATQPKLLILDEPTHGVDVGAKSEIYALIRNLADQGMGVILISSELPEVLTLAHRIVVMHEGRVTGVIDHSEATEEVLMAYATGLRDDFGGAERMSPL
jgi:ABC-type sugar transport system ATPase subunit